MDEALEFVKELFKHQLQMGQAALEMTADTVIVEVMPQFDSMVAVNIITAIEEQLGVEVDDAEISGELFETVGSLAEFIYAKMTT